MSPRFSTLRPTRWLAIATLLAATAHLPAQAAPGPWKLDKAHSSVNFNVRHLMVSKVRGTFDTFDSNLKADAAGRLTWAKGTVQVKSVNTANKMRDNHLRGKEFFEAGKFKTMTFETTQVDYDGSAIKAEGKLTIKGVTRTVLLTGEHLGVTKLNFGGPEEHSGFSFTTRINRQDFGLKFNGMSDGKAMVDDWVNIDLELEIARKL